MMEETGGRITSGESITVMTVRELAWEWLFIMKNRIKDSTAANYRMKIERHILPEFGAKVCASIKTRMISEFIQKKLSQGLSARYVGDIITVMKAMYRYAANEYNITNVIEGVVMPKKAKPEINIMTAEEKRKLVYYINTNHNETTLAVALSLFTGMRIGEVCALRWQDIDIEKRVLYVRHTKDSNALKLLFCIDMLNEGVHFDDVDGVIMLRATQSANVFYQQLGRALACSDSKKKPVIFDIVNNFETGDTAQQYAGFMEIAHGEGAYDDDIEFELYDYVRDIREILNELNDTFANSWDFNFDLLKEYAEKCRAFPNGSVSYEGVLIGKWATQQRVLNNQGKIPKERVKKLNDIGFPWDLGESFWAANYEELKSLVKTLGHFPKKSEFSDDKKNLYGWLAAQKLRYRSGELGEEKAEKLVSLGCEMTKGNIESWQDSFEKLGEFVERHGRFPNNADTKSDPDLKILYTWARSQRTARLRGQLSEDRIAKLDSIGFQWDKFETEWANAFEMLKRYYKERDSLPGINELVDGYKLGKWYQSQVVLYSAGNMQAHRVERFKEAGIPLENIRQRRKNEVFMKYYDSYMEYLQKFGKHPASKDRYNDLDLVKWRCTQMQKKRQGNLTDEQANLLATICRGL